jgi:hypothetical protein
MRRHGQYRDRVLNVCHILNNDPIEISILVLYANKRPGMTVEH